MKQAVALTEPFIEQYVRSEYIVEMKDTEGAVHASDSENVKKVTRVRITAAARGGNLGY